jgi:molybdopterin-guanine dinucleotide biosynthesis protein A
VLEARLDAGELSLRDALAELDVRTVELDSALLTSVNTERDLDRLRAIAAT